MKISFARCLLALTAFSAAVSCTEHKTTLFTKLESGSTHIDFRNLVLEDNERFSCLNFPYYYNGGGVAIGDFNNDSLPDIVFTGSMVKNRLYINKGNFEFEDKTQQSGIAQYEGWCTGVAIADVNQDGWNDIYICRSAVENPAYRTNLLFINNHDLTFTEKAAAYGVNDTGYTTQASFFDYDKDGDLDLFLIEQSKPEYSLGGYTDFGKQKHELAQPTFENKLFRNDGDHFTNVTHAVGISSNTYTFSLGISTADINMDGYPDIYISNDYNEEDYVYINNRDGTFTNQLQRALDHVALYSMGCDIADYNNDGLPDICTLDMLPESNYDLKMHSSVERFDKYQQFLSYGYYPFFMRNQLQKNNGDSSFSEIGRLAGIAATNWSWSALFADYDLDGKKDLFVTNGVKRDITNLEYMRFASDNAKRVSAGGAPMSFTDFLTHIPGEISAPYLYRNLGKDVFVNEATDDGLDQQLVSNGAAYADLDNDGDLDLITNNIDEPASVFRNNAETLRPQNKFLQCRLTGTKANPDGIGAKIFMYAGDTIFYQEQLLTRGFQSGVDPRMTVGLGTRDHLDSLRIIWPDDAFQVIGNVKTGQVLRLDRKNAGGHFDYKGLHPAAKPLLSELNASLQYQHVENRTNDFNLQALLPHFYSHNGPCMAKADINHDGRDDIFIGGALGSPGKIFIQKENGRYEAIPDNRFKSDKACEDVAAAFLDVNKDGFPDLYLVSGGYEFEKNIQQLSDRLYLNDGKGGFRQDTTALPPFMGNKSCIAVADINGDGYPDLFIGGGVIAGEYPQAAASRILMNDGNGRFVDKTKEICPSIAALKGIVSSALWTDANKDGRKDLVIAGEWMPVLLFTNTGAGLASPKPLTATGWWTSIAASDMDGDEDEDLICGNFGLNSPLRADSARPVELFFTDIDHNGVVDPYMTYYSDGTRYPFVGMDDATMQVPSLRKKFYQYPVYAKAKVEDIFSTADMSKLPQLDARMLQSVYLENNGTGFTQIDLPVEAQYAPLYVIVPADFNHDGQKDLLLLGNNKYNRLRIGQLDANHGVLLEGNGKGAFRYVPQYRSGLRLRGDLRSAEMIGQTLLVGVNDGSVKMFSINP